MKTSYALGALAIALAAGSASAGLLSINGDTTGGPTYNRPLAGNPPTGLSAVGTAVRYQAFTISVDTSATYLFDTFAGTLTDSFMFLYGPGGFNAASPLTNVLVGDDDTGTGNMSQFSRALTAGTNYTVVVTGFGNTDFGTYRLDISGVGNITLVPAPGAVAALALAGVVAARRRRA